MQLRPIIRSFFLSELGDGSNTFAWYDNWCSLGSLDALLTPRTITSGGFSLQARMNDICVNMQLQWPAQWLTLYPMLTNITLVLNVNASDKICWKVGNEVQEYSSMNAWQGISTRDTEVTWAEACVVCLLYSKTCVPYVVSYVW